MNKLFNYIKQNKAQVSNTTIWIILVLFVIFISFYMFSEKADMFTSMVEVSD